MDSSKKIRINNYASYLAVVILTFCLILAIAVITIPHFPRFPNKPGEQRLLVSTWNFACTLMWIMVLRLQVFNELTDYIELKEHKRSVTPWVKFWFAASILIGLATIIYVTHSFLAGPFGSLTYLDAFTAISIVMWVVLTGLSISLFLVRKNHSKEMLYDVKKAVSVHRWVIGPSSLMFLLSILIFAPFFIL
jgi:hypothetical protein